MKKLIYFSLAVISAVACTKVTSDTNPQAKKISIDPVITKANETNFEEGDKIGLTIKRGSETYASNEVATFDGSVFKSDVFWYTEGEQNSVFEAYYPYQDAFPTSFEVAQDQSGTGYGASDFMAAVKDNVEPQSQVTMVFKHLLTRIVVNVDNQLGANINSIVLKGSKTKCIVDFPSISLDTESEEKDITCATVTPGSRYAAIVVPQTVAFTVVINLDGKVISKNLTATQLKAGGQYTVNMTILPSDVKVAIAGEIENWSDEGVITDKVVTFHEYLDAAQPYFEYDGLNYKVVKLADNKWWMAEPLAFLPDGVAVSDAPSATSIETAFYPYSSDGTTCTALTDAASIKAKGYLYKAAAVFGKDITSDNYSTFEGKQGICPTGWHVPTRAEYLDLVGYSNKSEFLGETAAVTKTDAYYYDSGYNGAKITTLNSANFNFTLSGTVSNYIYQKLILSSTNCSVEGFYGNPSMTYLWTSSPNKANQFFALMTTFNTSYKEGRLTLAFADVVKAAAQLRCVRDE